MSNERYPQDLTVSLQDFEASGWKDAIAQATREGYSAMWQALSAAARSAIEQGRVEHGKVLWLLADACSMMLSPSSPNEPFKPFAVFHDRRSVIPDDLLDTDITFFAEIVDAVDDNWLKARLSDLLWLKGKPRNTAFALKAIDAYRCLPLDTDTWVHGGRECWPRAISLARMLKRGAGDRLQQMEATIVTAFDATKRDDGFLGLWLADLLKTNGLGRAHRANVAKKLEALAREFDGEGDLHRAREYFSAAAEWFRAVPDQSKAAEMTVAVAEGWVKEAVARTASESPSHMVAASFYENAIQTYRTIPRAERSTHRVDERIAEIRARLNDSGERALGEMGFIQTPGVDITQLIENARKSVTGKSAQHALLAFANLHRGANAEELRDNALERMRQYPLQSLFAATVMSRDGRVIAKRPAMSLGSELTADDEIAIRAEMIRDYGILVSIVVQGDIWPALEVLLLEHRLREVDFIALARNSPIVPKDRAGLFGKALFAGYERDFVTALHLLIPQIEHLVRVHLKQAGAKTTNIDKDGIQNENGMSTLLELPEAVQVFGKDLAFELNSLFCDAFGPNLRNELAHGLLDEDGCNSPFAIYAWWLALRLTFNTWWNSANPAARQQEVNDEQAPTAEHVEEQGEP
ncbi:DUF4209 domain-containing protein [Escherichia coli]|nr:DUF4209 domain-containing protein [Escherichia coli]EFH8780973.1 DUF4209 domain-containing protein [Escherichia coli]EFJ1987885.1 DUF4209 domain-containing protein [Escherichia coli]EFO6490448.1 DUF4209 domain-containing protein [Escherichia coli]EFT1905055.1 DUF4209 domain-containing protein [Escherichia coli]